MFRKFAATILAAVLGFGAASASAATIGSFSRATNDGVFTLTGEQAAFLGTPTADRIAHFRVRSGGSPSVSWAAGDDFTLASFLASVTSNASAILGVFNGLAEASLDYAGDRYDAFTGATFLSSSAANGNLVSAVLFTFNSASGDIVFRGSTTFNGGQTRGASDVPGLTPVPLPAAAWMLLAGLGGLAAVARRRARA